MQTGKCLQTLHKHRNMVRTIAFYPRGHQLASASADETICLWDCETWNPLQVLWSDRPYERMNIVNVTGVTEARRESLIGLGAINYVDEDRWMGGWVDGCGTLKIAVFTSSSHSPAYAKKSAKGLAEK